MNDKIDRIAKMIMVMPTIYNTSPYKISVYPDDAEGSHKERHISVIVQKGDESGTISIRNGELLAGYLSPKTMKWCLNEFLTDENKMRINLMIENDDYYRLDRSIEVKSHPLQTGKTITAFYDDKKIISAKAIGDYKIEISFNDGIKKAIDIKEYISRHPRIFKELIENPGMMNEIKIEPMGTGVFWNDLMGIENIVLWSMCFPRWLYCAVCVSLLDEIKKNGIKPINESIYLATSGESARKIGMTNFHEEIAILKIDKYGLDIYKMSACSDSILEYHDIIKDFEIMDF